MRILTSSLLLLVLLVAGPVVAQEKSDATGGAKAVAPYVDEQTVLIARVDVSRLEVDPLVDMAFKLARDVVPEAEVGPDGFREEEALARAQLNGLQSVFRQAGGKEVYLLFSLADFDLQSEPAPFLIVPLAEGADEKTLAALFSQTGLGVQERLGNVLFVGNRATLDRLKAIRPSQRPEIAAALQATGDAAAQVMLLPPKYATRVIEEMLPNLPKEIGGGPSTVITHGFLWAAVSVDLPPKRSVKLVIQSRDAEAAKTLRETWIAAVALLGQQKGVRQMVPAFDKLATLLTPKVQGDRLTLIFDEED